MPDENGEIPFRTFGEAYHDSPASVLTPAQREYFFGERDLTGSSERALLRRIRHRIRAASWDFLLLVHTFPHKEMEKIRTDDEDRVEPLHSLAGFLYAAQPENPLIASDLVKDGPGTEAESPDRRAQRLQGTISRGIEQAISSREGVEADVDVSITVDRGEDLESLAEGDLSRLSRDQLDLLLHSGTISKKEYGDANARRLERTFE
ncbi:hypothetical protein [Halalkalicoccus ordinarius]|uniref:hypothetical protein n=1 Tax=Halalkalicoccus ordinarius TaxID=3116651 RepID=UPI00300EA531